MIDECHTSHCTARLPFQLKPCAVGPAFHSSFRQTRAVARPSNPTGIKSPLSAAGFRDELENVDFRANHFESESKTGLLIYSPQVDLRRLIHGVNGQMNKCEFIRVSRCTG
jgi:hypothetical protein